MTKHALQTLLDSIWNEGHTPQIVVDATSPKVVVPEHVRARWKDALAIDLDANYPLNIDFSDLGISADLAFQGHVCRCFFPWDEIRAVVDRSTTKGWVSPGSLPGSLLSAVKSGVPGVPESEAPTTAKGWTPKVIKGGKS